MVKNLSGSLGQLAYVLPEDMRIEHTQIGIVLIRIGEFNLVFNSEQDYQNFRAAIVADEPKNWRTDICSVCNLPGAEFHMHHVHP